MLLILFSFLAGVSYTLTSEGTIWPVAHAVLPPELRGSSRVIISMVISAISALALSVSGVVADTRGVTIALQWFVPGMMLVSVLVWMPMFRAYPQDRDKLQKLLSLQREDLFEQIN